MSRHQASSRIAVAVLAFGVASATWGLPTRRGAVAFNYSGALSAQQLDFYAKFDVLVTHDPLPKRQVDFFHERGTKLVLYEWSVAFYESLVRTGSHQERLLASNREELLNSRPLRGGAGSPIANAYYYDPASPAHAIERSEAVIERLRETGYDGLFFDTTTVESVHIAAREEYERRNHCEPYDEAFGSFLAALRREKPDITLITNQGYRAAAHYLPYADYDVTESLITRPGGNGFAFRPWNESRDPWNSFSFLMRELIGPVRQRYPDVRFVHLNYLNEMRPHDVATVIASARLFGDEAFVTSGTVEARGEEIHDDYFIDLGALDGPVISTPEFARRAFTKGVVTINHSNRPVIVDGVQLDPGADGMRGVIRTLTVAKPCE